MATPTWWKNSSLEMSKRYQASHGQLRCITCQVIHNPPTPGNRVAYYRAKCLTCHNDASCQLPIAERMQQLPANDCVGCHMPGKPVAGIAHSDDTYHRIVRRAGQPLPDSVFEQPTSDLPGLLCLNKPKDERGDIPLLTKLLAYAEVMGTEPSLQQYYFSTLKQLSMSSPDDPARSGRSQGYEATPRSNTWRALSSRPVRERACPNVLSQVIIDSAPLPLGTDGGPPLPRDTQLLTSRSMESPPGQCRNPGVAAP